MKFVAADEIVTLKQGKEQIIFNALYVNPAYFPRGGREVLYILDELKKLGTFTVPPENLCPPELFSFLKFHSLIVPENSGEMQEKRGCLECGFPGGKSSQRNLYLLLSQSCNQACIYCYNGLKTYELDKHLRMSEEVAYKAVKTTFDTISENGRLEIVFFGGEPLMNWPLAKKVINYCETELLRKNSGKKIFYHLTTNLTLFPEDLIEWAKKYNITFLVDIDGPEDIHNKTRPFIDGKGSFAVSAKNIEKLNKAGLQVALRATVTSHNADRMVDVTKTHRELGGAGSAFVGLNPVDSDGRILPLSMCPSIKKFLKGLKEVFHSAIWPVENLYPFNEYLQRLRPGYENKWGCGAPTGNTPVITSDGRIFSCIYLVGIDRYEVGHIDCNDFPRKNVIQDMIDIVNVDAREKCRECGFRYLCGGGCPVGVFSIAGNPKASKSIKKYVQNLSCGVSRKVLEELFWYKARNTGIKKLLGKNTNQNLNPENRQGFLLPVLYNQFPFLQSILQQSVSGLPLL